MQDKALLEPFVHSNRSIHPEILNENGEDMIQGIDLQAQLTQFNKSHFTILPPQPGTHVSGLPSIRAFLPPSLLPSRQRSLPPPPLFFLVCLQILCFVTMIVFGYTARVPTFSLACLCACMHARAPTYSRQILPSILTRRVSCFQQGCMVSGARHGHFTNPV